MPIDAGVNSKLTLGSLNQDTGNQIGQFNSHKLKANAEEVFVLEVSQVLQGFESYYTNILLDEPMPVMLASSINSLMHVAGPQYELYLAWEESIKQIEGITCLHDSEDSPSSARCFF